MLTLKAIIQSLPAILRFVNSVVDFIRVQEAKGVGRMEALNAGMRLALQELAEAAEAEREAQKAHDDNPDTDDGFLNEFRRD